MSKKIKPEWVLTGVGDASSPARAVKTNGGALREAVGFEGPPLERLNGPQDDSCISLDRVKRSFFQVTNIITDCVLMMNST